MTTNARESATRLADLLRAERDALAEFLLALSRFHRDRLWMDLGYQSLFAFLRRELRLSEGAAGSTGQRRSSGPPRSFRGARS